MKAVKNLICFDKIVLPGFVWMDLFTIQIQSFFIDNLQIHDYNNIIPLECEIKGIYSNFKKLGSCAK